MFTQLDKNKKKKQSKTNQNKIKNKKQQNHKHKAETKKNNKGIGTQLPLTGEHFFHTQYTSVVKM